jgi:hypothetical protein
MRSLRTLPLLALVAIWPGFTAADTGSTLDRALRRQPAYVAKPQYCLLLFGPEGKTRVWLVAAGEAFYADTNGNGDLTQPGKRIFSQGNFRWPVYLDPSIEWMWFPVPENERVYNVGDVYEPATRTWYHLTVRRLGRLEKAIFEIEVDIRGQFRQLGLPSHFGETQKNAPVLHFGGPLTLGLFTSQLVRGAAPNNLEAWIGTDPCVGTKREPTYLVLDDWLPASVSPIASVEFPSRTAGGKPIRSSARLAAREGLVRFSGKILVPEEAGPGKAKIRLAIPGWKAGAVRPAAMEIPIVRPQSKSAAKSGT